mmetsp:Transcript_5277/g.16151  ORF Transcript_5277/g.16151 Transcript_5277/m.16151 type:complete len:104 (-) Transcript_5277:41-352(-)
MHCQQNRRSSCNTLAVDLYVRQDSAPSLLNAVELVFPLRRLSSLEMDSTSQRAHSAGRLRRCRYVYCMRSVQLAYATAMSLVTGIEPIPLCSNLAHAGTSLSS